MLGHLGLNVPALDTAKAYYDQLMPLLGFTPFFVAEDEFSYRPADAKPGTFIFFYPTSDSGLGLLATPHRAAAPGLHGSSRTAVRAVHDEPASSVP